VGFFAVLVPRGQSVEMAPSIQKCHINLLPRDPFGHSVVFDVGVDIRASDAAAVRSVTFALPFGIDEQQTEDLLHRIADPDVASLFFSRNIHTLEDKVTLTGSDGHVYKLRHVMVHEARLDTSLSTVDISVIDIPLRDEVPPAESAYVRMRFGVASLGRMWIWKRSGFALNGALLDFRIADVREAVDNSVRSQLEHRIVPLPDVSLLVMLPWQYQIRMHSPPLRYARLLEDTAWQTYLDAGNKRGRHRQSKFVLYYWRWRDQMAAIGVGNPARAFLDVSSDTSVLSWANCVRIGLVVLVVDLLVQLVLGRLGATSISISLPTRWPTWPSWLVAVAGAVTVLTAAIGTFRSFSWLAGRVHTAVASLTQLYKQR
jgi:hypothetical protein